MRKTTKGGGWPAVRYALSVADRVGWTRLWRAMRSRNACKTCALGMGGQKGGMRNEAGHWPEVCKKSLQAMAADMQDGLRGEFYRRYGFAELRTLSPRDLEAAGRIVHPLYAGPDDTRYSIVDWDFALDRIADRIRRTPPAQGFFYASGRSSNEAAFLLQLFARLYGTNHVNNCSYYCHQASGVGLAQAIGSGTASIVLDDVENADLLFLIGGNPASNHPRLMRTMMKIRRRGGHVIVINPLKETGLVNFSVPSDLRSLFFGSEIASDYLQPRIGGDIALLTGIAKRVIERNAMAADFIQNATEGFDAFLRHVNSVTWEEIERSCGVARADIERVAERYINARNVVFSWTMGVTHHLHGVENIRAICNLALLRGMVGRPYAGLMPIRGHSNVQGVGSVGVTPKLKDAIFQALQREFGIEPPTTEGYDTMRCLEAADRGDMRFAFCLGGNLFGANPDAAFTERAFGRIDTVVCLSTTLNTGHAWARGRETIVLPVLARDEEPQKTTQESMFNYVRLSDGGAPRHAGPRSEVEVIAAIAQRVLGDGGPIDFEAMRRHQTIRGAIARIVPGWERIGDIDRTREEFQIEGRTFHKPKFATPSGKAQFAVCELPDLDLPDGRLRLMTIRSEGQFNTVVYEEEDIYRNQERRDVVLMNEKDMRRLGLAKDDLVTVSNETGEMRNILVRPFDMSEGGVVMYFPEANALVPIDVDRQSRTPAYKSVPVRITKQSTPLKVLAEAALSH
ncbi:MAG TPA: FdhF/YdeP family oxidoreductase [Phycisphaerae bacterium]|nr:FdhF/YdeP family oxidoreductase [Phycisphaerae bacterium]HRW54165.1 FdhF/YdeP family oxidoreductase [Phycisphaerae bacterium]